MTLENPSEQTAKPTFAVWGLVKGCYGLLFSQYQNFIRIMAVPAIISVLFGLRSMDSNQAMIDVAQTGNVDALRALQMAVISDPLTYIYMAVMFITLAAAIVSIHRLVLLGASPPRPLGIGVGKRELRYIGYAIIVFLAAMLPSMTVVAFGAVITQMIQASILVILMTALMIAASIYVIMATLRFSLALPAVAVDGQGGVKARLHEAWQMAKGSTFKLFASLFLCALPIMLISMVFSAMWMDDLLMGTETSTIGVLGILVSTILNMMLYCVQTTVISRAYQVLSEGQR